MKKKIAVYVATVILTTTLLLNLTIESKAGQFVDTTSSHLTNEVSPCVDSDGNIFAYSIVCKPGNGVCVPETCPAPSPPTTE